MASHNPFRNNRNRPLINMPIEVLYPKLTTLLLFFEIMIYETNYSAIQQPTREGVSPAVSLTQTVQVCKATRVRSQTPPPFGEGVRGREEKNATSGRNED